MTEFDESVVQAFVEDSIEQLRGIGDDLLSIEAAGSNPEPEIVNHAFRAVHSVKGGAGFMALDRITELAHDMENVLNMVRNQGLVLTSEHTTTLLQAADALVEMLTDSANSNEYEIGEHLAALQHIAAGESRVDEGEVPEAADTVEGPQAGADSSLAMPDGARVVLTTTAEKAAEALQTQNFIYLVQYRRADLEGGKDEAGIVEEMEAVGGEVLEAQHTDGTLFVLFATAIDPEVIAALVEVDDEQIRIVQPEELPAAAAGVSEMPESLEAELAGVGDYSTSVPETVATEEVPPIAEREVSSLPPEALIAMNEEEEDDEWDSEWEEEELPDDEGVVPSAADEPSSIVTEAEVPNEPELPASAPVPPLPGRESQVPELAKTETPGTGAKSPVTSVKPPVMETSLRVNVELLDDLMNLAGELVLTRNQLIQEVAAKDIPALDSSSQRLDQVTSELQEAIVSTRMQPLSNIFGKFRRIVRDLAQDLDKDVDLQIEGEDVELDKTIIEALGDPLTHLVRNAMDHGIEPRERRAELGKRATARIQLTARHEAGQVLIEVVDDGAGIDPVRIRDKAISTGIVDRLQAETMSDRDVVRLIFHPGFSTAEEVTGLSGRGVGMDVVHTNLTNLGGLVDIETEVGVGTIIGITLPLTLAIIPTLLVQLADKKFAIPQVNIAELLRIVEGKRQAQIQPIGEARVLRLREQLLPLISMRQVLGIAGEDEHKAHDGATHVVVLKAGDFLFALMVDEVLDSREIVVKPLDKYLRDAAIYAGGTILGDGSVALILDVVAISQSVSAETVSGLSADDDELEEAALADAHKLLVVENAPGERFALPLSLVSRIEGIRRSQIENTGGRASIQYRGGHLLLFSLDQAANIQPLPDSDELFVVVFRVAEREVGLLVAKTIDIVVEKVAIEEKGFRQPGISGSTIVDGHTTLMVDLYGLVRHLDPEWVESHEDELKGDATLLLAEDTPFFRDQMRRCLEGAGYELQVAEDGAEALEILQKGYDSIDLVVTDIEMPRMDGLGLVRAIRSDQRLADLPVIAVTSLDSEDDRRRGVEAGVDDYLVKLDQEQLLLAVRRHLTEKETASK